MILNATTHDPHFLADPSAPPPSAASSAYGMLSQAELRVVFREAMEDVVLPGLELCGIHTGEARRWFQTLTDRWR